MKTVPLFKGTIVSHVHKGTPNVIVIKVKGFIRGFITSLKLFMITLWFLLLQDCLPRSTKNLESIETHHPFWNNGLRGKLLGSKYVPNPVIGVATLTLLENLKSLLRPCSFGLNQTNLCECN